MATDIAFKFFTQQSYLHSPLMYEALKDSHATRDQESGYVNMTVEVELTAELDKDDNPIIEFIIENKMWEDPLKDEKGECDNFFYSLHNESATSSVCR